MRTIYMRLMTISNMMTKLIMIIMMIIMVDDGDNATADVVSNKIF